MDFAQARNRMVETQIARRGVDDPRLLEAFRQVPREAFVDPGFEEFAYEDGALPIGEGQTISQPYVVALMIDAAAIEPGDRVLDVGAGSGYAAAVISRIADRVLAIERLPGLAGQARSRFSDLGYDNVELRVGDGSEGWPEEAPFDAILVAAGSPEVPRALKRQLAVGGRLVIPVGEPGGQTLLRVERLGEEDWREQDLGGVAFVPLIGLQAWREDGTRRAPAGRPAAQAARLGLPEAIAEAAKPIPDLDDPAFGELADRFAGRRVVLLGEASHGTSEFYRARAAITRRLIERHGFTAVAVEADWPDAAAIDRYVRHRPAGVAAEAAFRRFPTWMWRNREVEAFADWLRARNEALDPGARAGFYGLDLYSLSASIAAVLGYLDEVDPEAAAIARERYGCLTPWQRDPATYGRAVLTSGYARCERAVADQCRDLLAKRLEYEARDGEGFLDAEQNARLVAAAERYYRVMYYGGPDAWNLRDRHMFETLERLLEAEEARLGRPAKAVVWAHNSHIGDARHTDMGQVREELNLGQLCRERFGEEAALVGLGTHAGTVAAARDWGDDVQVMTVRPSREGSYERLCHDSGLPGFLLDFGEAQGGVEALRERLLAPRLERFIGVIYRPDSELASHYAAASLPRQFDAWLWFDESRAVTPLGPRHARPGAPETYPFGL